MKADMKAIGLICPKKKKTLKTYAWMNHSVTCIKKKYRVNLDFVLTLESNSVFICRYKALSHQKLNDKASG